MTSCRIPSGAAIYAMTGHRFASAGLRRSACLKSFLHKVFRFDYYRGIQKEAFSSEIVVIYIYTYTKVCVVYYFLNLHIG